MTSRGRCEAQRRQTRRAVRVYLTGFATILAGAALLGMVATGCSGTGEGTARDTVTAKEFRLVNDAGETRAVLALEEDSPTLRFYDRQGRIRASLLLTEASPRLVLNDENGKPGLSLGLSEQGSALALGNAGNVRILLTVDANGSPELLFRDSTGKTSWSAPK